jgi:large repetitive protein
VAWWRLDETEGLQANDASGHGLAANVQGEARWKPVGGRFRGALDLDGTQTYVDCGDKAEFDLGDTMTVSLWLKPRGPRKGTQALAGKGSETWYLNSEGESGRLTFFLNGPQATGKDRNKRTRVASKRQLDDGQWHHVVGLYDGQRMALYVDGVLENSVAASGRLALNTEPLWLGNSPAARGEWYNGLLDDVRLYRHGLSEEEIKALYRGARK